MSTHPPVLRLPQNTRGRDFVVGDIHGAYNSVLAAMKLVGFDPVTDRLLSVGDLIDRGPESARSSKFLDKPYVFAIKGNHEANLLAIYAQGEPSQDVLNWFVKTFNVEWWLDVSAEQRQIILGQFAKLPIAMEVATERGSVGLVHGNVPVGMSWQTFLARLEANDQDVVAEALEGRDRIKYNDMSGVAGIDRLYVGHSVQRGGPKRYGNVFAIDSGAIFRELRGNGDLSLTLANLASCTQVLSAPRVGTLPAVIAVDEVPDRPFGAYAQSPA